ncbi:recyclin-1 [[Emmonsia] crescens]|uniref:Recyclin-1 n=1 Tax=[Emmonsia] crescens TaxID=73230 RepID=A0A2B7ZMG2_9EURO|nr:recyclin-1 [Emmonsia crescens]
MPKLSHIILLLSSSCIFAIPTLVIFTVTVSVPGPTLLPLPPAASPTIPPSYASDKVFHNTILAVTNRYRRDHNATALTWNRTLEASSRHWARQCHWAHSTSGENLAMGYANVTTAVQAWGDERTLFDFDKPRFTHETGHFSQLVWKGTKTVGCARFHCGDYANRVDDDDVDDAYGWYVVCQYFPVGNIIGGEFFEENVQAKVSGGAARVRSGMYEGWEVVVTLFAVLVGVFGVG